MKTYRAATASPEKIAKQNEYRKRYRASPEQIAKQYRAATTSPEKIAKQNEYMKQYRAAKASIKDKTANKNNVDILISKFHNLVDQGPLYVCTCCDQLWYKHSVLGANKLRQSSPDIVKYLCNKKSVNNIEWVCRKMP